jgi:hypothetical protein
MLAKVHQSKKSMVLSEQVLKSAMNAIKDAAKIAAGSNASPAGMSAFVRAESEISYALNLSEIGRLSTLSVTSRDWWTSLDAVFTLQREVSTKLHDSVLYRRDVVTFLIFARAIVSLLERKWSELDSNSSLSTTNNGILSCEALARYAKLLCDSATRCRSSRDALLSLAVPIEGVAEQSFSPPEVLAAKLDIWEARSASLHRDLVAAAKVEQSHAKRTRIVESAELVNASVMSLPERIAPAKALCVARSWPEEDTGIDPVEQFAKDWVVEVDGTLSEADRQQSLARAASAIENSILVVSNAVTTLQSVYSDEEPSGTLDIVHPACEIDALVELGRLQLERAKQLAPLGTPSKWEEPVPDSREQQGMELGERYSMILQSRDPTEVYKLPAEVAAEAGADSIGLSEATEQEAKISEDMAKATLCEAVRKAIVSRHFSAAHRALKALGLEAFGVQCPEASFEFLVWLQSVDTCMRAEETYAELVEDDHQERVQMGLLQRLGSTWFDPTQLAAYQASVKRLCRDSPFFQRLRLADMPSINELLLSFLPPLTLVVTLQMHGDYLYVGAACTPADGDPQQRMPQIKHLVTRMHVVASELHALLLKLNELNLAIEKELIISPALNQDLVQRYDWIVSRLDSWIVQPIVRELATCCWPYTTHIENAANPKQLMLLPDHTLWGFPLERCRSFDKLFDTACRSVISRDFSLHVSAQRVRSIVEPAEGAERKPLKAAVPGFRLDTTSLLTDPFAEDVVKSTDDPKMETLSMLHDRLVTSKIVGNEKRSFHGSMFTASPHDIKGMLLDSSAFLSLGFSRFFVTMPAKHFASQDLRRLSLLGIFNRCLNDASFRRQTKIDSMKTLRQVEAENAYGTSLMASFRGVQTIVMTTAPVPIALASRCVEAFGRALQAGKPVSKAFEEILSQQIKDPNLRFTRALEGGELPPQARVSTVAGGDAKSGGKSADPKAEQETFEDLLQAHTQAAYLLIGAPWIYGEPGSDAPKGKK